MPQTINRFYINSYFDISRNININVDNFNYDYILNLDMILYPQFTGMNTFFTIYNYTINPDLSLGQINLTLNKDLVKSLLTYDFNKYSKNGIIKFDPANTDVYTNPDFDNLTITPCKFAFRMLEIIATKIFGNCQDYILIDNGIDFYKSDGVCLINQVIDDLGNLFNDNTVLNNIMTAYQNDPNYDNSPGTHNFEFNNSVWEFPMFYSDSVSFIDGADTDNFDGPNMGGSEVDNGSYNIPILLRFWGVGGNAPSNLTGPPIEINNLSAISGYNNDFDITRFKFNYNITTSDCSGYVNKPAIIDVFTEIKYGSNFYLLNQPFNQYAFIFTPGELDNISTTDYYLTIFDNNNRILYNLLFGEYKGNVIYDNINHIWQILIPQPVNLVIGNNYRFNILVYPNGFTNNVDPKREMNVSKIVQSDQFYIFKTTIINNDLVLNFYPPYLKTNMGNVTNTNYNLTIFDNSSNIIINNVILLDTSYKILNLTINSNYTGVLTSNSTSAGNNQFIFSFYNYQITDLSASFITPQTQNSNDLGNWFFNWIKPNNYINDTFITQSFQISTSNSDLSSNIVFYQDEYLDTSLTLSIYDLINIYGYNLDINYFKIIGYWIRNPQNQIISCNSLSFSLELIPLPPTNLAFSDSGFNFIKISWTPSVYPNLSPQSYTYTNYIITVTSADPAFSTINKVISYTGISSYIINNLYYNKQNYIITIATLDSLTQSSSTISIVCNTGNKYASNLVLLNQPNNQYLFSFIPGTLDVLITTDYCLKVFDLNNTNLGTFVFGATSNGAYNYNLNNWNYLLPSTLFSINVSYIFNLLVYPSGINNNVDTNREIKITLQIPINVYYITHITSGSYVKSGDTILKWYPAFINSYGLNINNYSITMDSSSDIITSINKNSVVNISYNILYNSQLVANMSNNITKYITNFTFFNYNVTDISANFIHPTELVNDLGTWQFTWTNPNLYSNDKIINQSIYLQNNESKYFYIQSCSSTILNLSVYDLYTLYNYDLNSCIFIIDTIWLSDSGTNINNINSITFILPTINPVVQATNITTDSITINWNFYNPLIINQYQMTINGTGFYTTPPDTFYTFTSLTTDTLYTIKIWALDINNNQISITTTLDITTN